METQSKIDSGFFFCAREAVHDAAQATILLVFKDLHHLVEGIAAVDGERQMELLGPIQLGLKGIELLLLKSRVPIEIQADLPYADINAFFQYLLHQIQHLLIVFLDLFGLEAHHHSGAVGELLVQFQHRCNGRSIHIGQEHHLYTSTQSTLHSLVSIKAELVVVDVSMGIYEIHGQYKKLSYG